MVILALDVGERRIGVAVADPEGRLASLVGAVIRRDAASTRTAIAKVVRERAVTHMLVGVPLGPNGEETARAASIRQFAHGLASALGVHVVFRDERHTTQDALMRSREATELPDGRRRGARRPPSPQAREAARRRIDAMAAAILLQTYLDEVIREGDVRLLPDSPKPSLHSPDAVGEEETTEAPPDLSEALEDALLDAIVEAIPANFAGSPRHGTGA
jgi:putative Holliday junction resolvase